METLLLEESQPCKPRRGCCSTWIIVCYWHVWARCSTCQWLYCWSWLSILIALNWQPWIKKCATQTIKSKLWMRWCFPIIRDCKAWRRWSRNSWPWRHKDTVNFNQTNAEDFGQSIETFLSVYELHHARQFDVDDFPAPPPSYFSPFVYVF